ncbi:hypothetical protein SEA_EDEN_24 [Microbacterium phage Eden]|uniref:DUF6378 domain-containing protein n=1 Tax=Microbacterium phage Eden TaxID=2250289 RepID=A0A345KWB7_9CAUD|nr:hypothetical protein HOT71_gp24 [Microbacterium phage Eden]AXH47319.1 hypothetical protein SEA_EDEN_24 [Microbacterium phage Eden]
MTARNPLDLQPGDRIRLVGPGWGSPRIGNEAIIHHIDSRGQAIFLDEREGQNPESEWIADEQYPNADRYDPTWAVQLVARAMPETEPSRITEVDTLLTQAIQAMTHQPYNVEPGVHGRETPAQAYMDQRNFWLRLLSEEEPASVDIFIENYPIRTDFDGKPGEPRVFDADDEDLPITPAEYTAAGLLKEIPEGWLEQAEARRQEAIRTTERQEVLGTASNLIHGDREDDYGRPIDSFRRVAQAFNVVLEGLGHPPIDATTAAKLMIALKLSRLSGGDNKLDTWVDLAGYAALGFEVHSQEASE